MNFPALLTRAEKIVARTQQDLPAQIREIAARVPVTYEDWPAEDILGADVDPDILGLFIGDHHGIDSGGGNSIPAQIILFLENIYDEADGDLAVFDEEVRITYLHELGHYLGWDEDAVEARGL